MEAIAAELRLQERRLESTQTALRFYSEPGYVRSAETRIPVLTGSPAAVPCKPLGRRSCPNE